MLRRTNNKGVGHVSTADAAERFPPRKPLKVDDF